MLKVYLHSRSAYCQKVLAVLYEKGIEFEPIVTDLFDPATREAYCAEVNPLGKIPFLVRSDGWVIPESSIIMEYLDTYFPTEPVLIAPDRDIARQVRFYDRLGDLYLIAPAGVLYREERKPESERNASLTEQTRADALTALRLFNAEVSVRKYLSAGHFTMADIAPAIGIAALARRGFDLAEFPNLLGYVERVWSRPAWQRLRREMAAVGLDVRALPVVDGAA